MNEATVTGYKIKLKHIDHIEVDDIKYFKRFVQWNGTKKSAIKVVTHANYRTC